MREEKPKGTKCPGINGVLSEGDELTGDVGDKHVLDAAVITSAQAVEHYQRLWCAYRLGSGNGPQ